MNSLLVPAASETWAGTKAVIMVKIRTDATRTLGRRFNARDSGRRLISVGSKSGRLGSLERDFLICGPWTFHLQSRFRTVERGIRGIRPAF
jgi:hypothetical protein